MTAELVALGEIDSCFQGAIPSALASCSPEGTPNVTFISIVHRLSETHVGLSRQFFNKTIANMQRNPRAQVVVTEPTSGRLFRLDLLFERTETEGSLFDRVSARLDAVASAERMESLFRLTAVDVCRVLSCTKLASDWDYAPAPPSAAGLDSLDAFSLRIAEALDVDELTCSALDACAEIFGCEHSLLLLADKGATRLYTVASRGFESSGVGAEVAFGEGIIGVAAQRRQPVRIGNMASDIAYAQAVRSSVRREAGEPWQDKDIELPVLPNALSQLAVPILARGEMMGVLCLQSDAPGAFGAREESLLNVAARQIGLTLQLIQASPDHEPMITAPLEVPTPRPAAAVAQIKYYAADDSIFIDNEYIIKGVAGRILWRLLRTYNDERRVEFTNKEIRLDPMLDLPDIKDNLEARLILLRRRLEERCSFLRIGNTGRGRFRLLTDREIELREVQ